MVRANPQEPGILPRVIQVIVSASTLLPTYHIGDGGASDCLLETIVSWSAIVMLEPGVIGVLKSALAVGDEACELLPLTGQLLELDPECPNALTLVFDSFPLGIGHDAPSRAPDASTSAGNVTTCRPG